jgi:hypothetical protein
MGKKDNAANFEGGIPDGRNQSEPVLEQDDGITVDAPSQNPQDLSRSQ